MTVIENVRTLPRAIVRGYLQAVRLPLTVVARAAHQQDNEQWPPALAFESFEAGVETTLGSVLRDASLVDKGRLRQAKISQLRQAAELSTLADQERVAADEQAKERRQQIADQRKETERKASQSKNEIQRQAELREQKAKESAAKKASAARELKAAQDKAIARQARAKKSAALAAEAQALDVTKQALQAEEKVDIIDDTLEGTKAARKSG